MKKLPLGIQSFSKIIQNNYLYVDKTHQIAQLIQSGDYVFLSRPRRFGKSLLISTLYEIFSGNKSLFQGLAIYDQIEWQAHPIIHLDFSVIDYASETKLQDGLINFIDGINKNYQLEEDKWGFKAYFEKILQALAKKYGKVVILVDEYDKPIIDYIEDDIARSGKNREILKEFFGVLKSQDAFLRFVFFTGVSKFSPESIFSELNNLRDITLSKEFATLLGYTQTELESYFETEIQKLGVELGIEKAPLLAKIKMWYLGYSWNAKDIVYNPFAILYLFVEQ